MLYLVAQSEKLKIMIFIRKYTPFPLISESVNYFKEYEPINLMGVPIQLLSYSLIINLVFAIIVIALGYYFYNTNFRES